MGGDSEDRRSERLQFYGEFLNERDRATAILGGVFLDEALSSLLQAYFANDTAGASSLLDDRAPLSTFSARIDIAYMLGFLAKNIRNELHLIRRIRNDFAHGKPGMSFETGPIRDRCLELKIVSEQPWVRGLMRNMRERYRVTVIYIGDYVAEKTEEVRSAPAQLVQRATIQQEVISENGSVVYTKLFLRDEE